MRPFMARKCRSITEAQIDDIAVKYLRGATIEQLAIEYHVSATPIRNALRIRRVPKRKGAPRRQVLRTPSRVS